MQIFPGFVHILVALDTFCGFKWVKTSSKINMKYLSRYISFTLDWLFPL